VIDKLLENQIIKIHNADVSIGIVATGGGMQSISWLLSTPGASKTMLFVDVPYSKSALHKLTGEKNSFLNIETAYNFAQNAYQRGSNLLDTPKENILGIGWSSALTTNRIRKGKNICYVAICTNTKEIGARLELKKDARTRWEEDFLVSQFIIMQITQVLGLSFEIDLKLLPDEDVVDLYVR
tara:strand:+ start:572 stop:1117 length:546 start_codon:yes stop_codon:yes gene_type:complete